MGYPEYRISTRQRVDELFRFKPEDIGSASFPVVSDIRRVAGFSAISVLVVSDIAFTVTVEESCNKEGTNAAETQSFASAVDASTGLSFVCQRFTPCGSFATFNIDFGAGTPTQLSACFLGMPESATPGTPGPPGPPGPAGAQIVAADVVVDPGGTRSDVTTIADAIAALPAAGGSIFLHGGTYSISTTITLPDKPVKIIGSGQGVSIVDMGSNAIAAFTIGFDNQYEFEAFTIRGDGVTAGQIAFDHTRASATQKLFAVTAVDTGDRAAVAGQSGGVEITFRFAGSANKVVVTRCQFAANSSGARRYVTGGAPIVRSVSVRSTAGIGSGSHDLIDCQFESLPAVGLSVVNINAVACSFQGGTGVVVPISASSDGRFSLCNFLSQVSVSGDDIVFQGCSFGVTSGSPVRHIDFLAGSDRPRVEGCEFGTGFISAEAIRTESVGGVFVGNTNMDVLETSAADQNHYAHNTGFDGSTIIGATSIVIDWNTRTFTTGTHTLDRTHRTVLGDTSGGSITFNLPTAADGRYQIYHIKKVDPANTITIDASGAETIDGELTRVLVAEFDEITIQSDGTEWHILSYYLTQSDNFEWHQTVAPFPPPSRVGSAATAGYELLNAVTRGVIATIRAPEDFDTGVNPVVRIPYWVSGTGAASADVRMSLTVRYIADGELVSKAADETLLQTVSVTNTLDRQDEMSFTLNASLIARSDKINLFLERLGADGADTFTGEIAITEDASRLDYRRG